MKIFVAAQGYVTIRVRLADLHLAGDTAKFKLWRLTASGTKSLLEQRVPVVDGVATVRTQAIWLGDTESRCVVFFTVKAGENKAVSEDTIIVYRPTLRVVAVDSVSAVVSGATARLTLTVEDGFVYAGPAALTAVTNGRGEAVFVDVPPGDHAMTWDRPHLHQVWLQADGPLRRATIRKAAARFSFPDRGTEQAPHKQFVNLPRHHGGNQAHGQILDVQVAVAEGRAGEAVVLRVVSDGGERIQTFRQNLAADGGTVTFAVDLGYAAARFELSTGRTDLGEDQTIIVESWRRIALDPVFPVGFPNQAAVLSDAVKTELRRRFLPAQIEFVFAAPREIAAGAHVHLIDGEIQRGLGWTSPRVVYNDVGGGSPLAEIPPGGPDAVPTVHMYFLHGICQEHTTNVSRISATSRQTAFVMAPAGGFYRTKLDGGSIFCVTEVAVPGVPVTVEHIEVVSPSDEMLAAGMAEGDHFVSVGGTRDVEAMWDVLVAAANNPVAFIVSHAGHDIAATLGVGGLRRRFRSVKTPVPDRWVKRPKPAIQSAWRGRNGDGILDDSWLVLPQTATKLKLALQGQAAVGVDSTHPVSLTFKLTYYSQRAGNSQGAWMVMATFGTNATELAHALAHELAHCLGHTPADVPEYYNILGSGPHCGKGLAAHTDYGAGDEHTKERPRFGRSAVKAYQDATCTMFGVVGPATDFAQIRDFCADCIVAFRRQNLAVIDGTYHP